MPTQHGTRVDPLSPPDWGEAAHDALNAFPAARDFLLAALRAGQTGIQGLNLMGTQLKHPVSIERDTGAAGNSRPLVGTTH